MSELKNFEKLKIKIGKENLKIKKIKDIKMKGITKF